MNAGGRVAWYPAENAEVGITAVREGVANQEGELYWADFRMDLDENTEVRAEVAATKRTEEGEESSGTAYMAEITRRTSKVDARAYIVEQETGFGLGQRNDSESGRRKMGVEGSYLLTDEIEVMAETYRHTSLQTGLSEDVAEATVEMNRGSASSSAGVRTAVTETEAGERVSSQAVVSGTWDVLDGKAKLRAGANAPIGGQNGSGNFPKRLRVGVDYKLTDSVTVKAEQEFSWGDRLDTQGTRVGTQLRAVEGW
ncbi:MAG: hypothetical protein U5O39_15280 [Gammaproteobacteria bacterium]|nr:hypothetical protein [Gammaproteobacteria bacterium]